MEERIERMLELVLANQERMAAEVEGLKAEVGRLSDGAVSRLEGIESSLDGMGGTLRDVSGAVDSSSEGITRLLDWARKVSKHLEHMAEHMAMHSRRINLLRQDFDVRLNCIDADLNNTITWSSKLIGTLLGHLGFNICDDGKVVKNRR